VTYAHQGGQIHDRAAAQTHRLEGLTIGLAPIIQFLVDKTIEGAIISIFSDLSPYPMTTIIQGSNEDMGDLLSTTRAVTTPSHQ